MSTVVGNVTLRAQQQEAARLHKVVEANLRGGLGMVGEWREVQLGELSSDVSYGYTESANSEKVGPRFLRITDIQNGIVNWAEVPYCLITPENHDKYKLHEGDIVVARTGNSTGENYLYQGHEDAVFASYLIRFRIDPKKADPKFVWYNLRSRAWWDFINNSKTGSAQAGANAKVLGAFTVLQPPIPEQRAIAHILGTLDDKIELNRRRNQTLEAMARALFKDWFVDFGPVRAKMQLPSPSGRGAGGEGNNPQPRRKLPLPAAIRQHAAQLRRNATDAENLLWRLLRNQQLANAKFRRQHAVPPYILDFYCHELKLAVELDGGQHNEAAGRAHDARRTEYLHARGIKVLRFWNHDVLRETEAVLEAIYRAIEAKRDVEHSPVEPSPPAPLPEGEGSTARFGTEGEESTARFGVEGERSAARFVAKAMATTTHHASTDALKPFSPREKGWDEGAYLPPDLWNLFPDRLDDEGKPQGWRLSTIGNEVTVCGGSTPGTKEPAFWEGGEHHWATPKDLSALTFPVLLDTDRKITDAGIAKISSGLLPVGTVLLSSRAPIGYLAIAEVPTAINQGFIAMKCDGTLPNVFVLFWCRQNMDLILGNANGSTFQEISKSNFRPIPVIVPPAPILDAFRARTEPLYRHIVENERESKFLAQLRDTLLPKLISGELRIADADQFLENHQ